MAKKIFIVVETYRNDDITDTTELRGSFISRKKAIEKMNELYKELTTPRHSTMNLISKRLPITLPSITTNTRLCAMSVS